MSCYIVTCLYLTLNVEEDPSESEPTSPQQRLSLLFVGSTQTLLKRGGGVCLGFSFFEVGVSDWASALHET